MTILAGTDGGVFALGADGPRRVLESRCVRDLVRIGDRIFAGTDAGLFFSDDDGESWTFAGLGDREVWQLRGAGGATVYAATQPAGLFRSDDGGAAWEELPAFARFPKAADWCLPLTPPLPARARALVVDRENPRRIRLGVEVGGVMSSDDGGETWTLGLPGGNPDLHMMFAHPERPEILYASTGYGRVHGEAARVEGNAGVFRSDDRGATWRYVWRGVEPRYSRPMCIDPPPASRRHRWQRAIGLRPCAQRRAARRRCCSAPKTAANRGDRCATPLIRHRKRISTAWRRTGISPAVSSSGRIPERYGEWIAMRGGAESPLACRR